FPPNPIDMSKAIRYRNLAPITPDTPSGNDVRPGAQKTNAGSTAATVSLGTLVGVRVLSSGGNLTTLGSKAQKYGSPAQRGANGPGALTPGPQQSYWTIDAKGDVLAFGGAKGYGSLSSTGDTNQAIDLAAPRSGSGYWILTDKGGVWAFGSVSWLGSVNRTNP